VAMSIKEYPDLIDVLIDRRFVLDATLDGGGATSTTNVALDSIYTAGSIFDAGGA
jgi:hypothetical protein